MGIQCIKLFEKYACLCSIITKKETLIYEIPKKKFKLLIFLLMVSMLLPINANQNVYAKAKKVKWTATIAKKRYNYTGKKIKPKVTVKYKGKKLSKKNYKVKYPKNPVDDNTYKIKVTLKGKYKGKKLKGTKTIKISNI